MKNDLEGSDRLSRSLRTFDAVVIGLGAMIGAGIFAAVGPATEVAGVGIFVSILLAGGVAYLNAISVARLATIYPESGGVYVYASKQLGEFWGFLAGWGFVLGKLASCAAMALTFSHYLIPNYAKPFSVGIVLLLTSINYFGIRKTATATRILLAIVLISLTTVVLASLLGGGIELSRITNEQILNGPYGILQASGIMFFAFAGYARIATLGEEVVDPQNTIPKAIISALLLTLFIYLVVITTVLLCVDLKALKSATAPLVLAVESGRFSILSPIVRLGACVASVGVLLSLLAGVSRTIFAMASKHHLPVALSAVHSKYKVPHRAELLVGILVATVTSLTDVRSAIGFSSFAILFYYLMANISAYQLFAQRRGWLKYLAGLGAIFCITIALSLPPASVVGGLFLFFLGTAYYFVMRQNLK